MIIDDVLFLKKLTQFLEEYVDFSNDAYDFEGLLSDTNICAGIQFLIENNVFSKEELKLQFVRDYYAIIPEYYF